MPNTVRAAAEGMPSINRRKALAATGTALAGALVGLTAKAAATPAVATLIQAHQEAMDAESCAWDAYANLEGANRIPSARVQYGRLLGGRNDDGTDNWTLLYAYSEDHIKREVRKHWEAQASMFGKGALDTINDRFQAKLDRMLAEFRAAAAAEQEAEQQCGLDLARQTAREASAHAHARLEAILIADLPTVADIRAVSAHLVQCMDKSEIDDEKVFQFIRKLAGRHTQARDCRGAL